MATSMRTARGSADDKPVAHQVFDITELQEAILARLPSKYFFLAARISHGFHATITSSKYLKAHFFATGLSRLHHRFNSIASTLRKHGGGDLMPVDEFLRLFKRDRATGMRKVGISLITTMGSARATHNEDNEAGRYILHHTQQRPSHPSLLPEMRADAWNDMQAAYPSARLPVQLELALLTETYSSDEHGSQRRIVYRVSVSLNPVGLGDVVHIVLAIKRAIAYPHRRKNGLIDLGGFGVARLEHRHSVLFREISKHVAEEWKV